MSNIHNRLQTKKSHRRLLSGAEADDTFYLNHDFDKINKIPKINPDNLENLNKIKVQTKSKIKQIYTVLAFLTKKAHKGTQRKHALFVNHLDNLENLMKTCAERRSLSVVEMSRSIPVQTTINNKIKLLTI